MNRQELRTYLDGLEDDVLLAMRTEYEEKGGAAQEIQGVRISTKDLMFLINQAMVHEPLPKNPDAQS